MLIRFKTKLQIYLLLVVLMWIHLHSSRSETQRTYIYILLVEIRFSSIKASITYGHVMAAFDTWCHQFFFLFLKRLSLSIPSCCV
jgi:hypothetical protein